MSDFFNNFKKNLDKGMATVSVKSTTALEVNKLKQHLRTLTTTMEHRKVELGTIVYNMYLNNKFDESKYGEICEEIKLLEEQCKEKEAEIEGIKKESEEILGKNLGPVRCECGASIEPGMVFCVECGKKVN